MENYISIGKIMNFFGIKGEAKVGFDNLNLVKNAKKIFLLDDISKKELNIQTIRFHKNFAIIKFKEINDINDLLQYKGQRLFIKQNEAIKTFQKDEFFIKDLIGCKVFQGKDRIGIVESVSCSISQDLLNIKNDIGQISSVPFVEEFFPVVDIKNKKITIKPIEGLLS